MASVHDQRSRTNQIQPRLEGSMAPDVRAVVTAALRAVLVVVVVALAQAVHPMRNVVVAVLILAVGVALPEIRLLASVR